MQNWDLSSMISGILGDSTWVWYRVGFVLVVVKGECSKGAEDI